MSNGYGFHWSPCGGGGSGAEIAVIALIAIVGGGAAAGIAAAVAAMMVWIITAALVLIGAIAVGVVLRLVYLHRHPEARRLREKYEPRLVQLIDEERRAVRAARPPAIEQHYHVHLHGDADEARAARIIRQAIPGDGWEAQP